MSQPIRILIADDHAIVREGLRALIATEPGMQFIGEAANGLEAVELARTLLPDVILLDLVMPRKDGLQAIAEIMKDKPGAHILVLTSFAEDKRIVPALKAGAQGYLLKDSSPQELLQAVRDVYNGELPLDPKIAQKLIRELNRAAEPRIEEPLTERETEILKWMAQGLSNDEIAKKVFVSERTVRTHVSNILEKLHVVNRTQAVLHAWRAGWVSMDEQ